VLYKRKTELAFAVLLHPIIQVSVRTLELCLPARPRWQRVRSWPVMISQLVSDASECGGNQGLLTTMSC